ncbi:MAG TPA: D-Ala-D-Ala carboxypeptidase family metallohydrolase [Pyrinomonadaceae bacterium]|jgi:hypothetical protein
MVNLNMSLSENFKLLEFVTSVTASNHGIDNSPNNTEIEHLRILCRKILQPARRAAGPLKISSGFRSEQLNRLVGGAPDSDHRRGFAADVVPLSGLTRELAVWVARNCREFDQIILEFGTDSRPEWIHLSVAPKLRRQILRATKKDGQTIYRAITL